MKTIILGIDGGTLSQIEAYARKGYLPNFQHLLENGTKAILKSVAPPVTAPAWVSFMTGLPPDKHGILDFIDHSEQSPIKKVVSSSQIRSSAFWQLAGDRGKRAIVYNVPITYPPYPINGILITGMLTPSLDNVFTYPPELGPELRKTLGDYKIHLPWRKYHSSQISRFVNDIREATKVKTRYVRHLLKNWDWDLAVAVFTETDSLQHPLWNYIDESDQRDALGGLVPPEIRKEMVSYYQLLDTCLGEILDQIQGRFRLFIVSDHGFGPLKKRAHINLWLQQKGFLRYRMGKVFWENMVRALRRVVKFLDVWDLRTALLEKNKKLRTLMYRDNVGNTIDWGKTVAFAASLTEQGIYINLKGRQKHGVVDPSDFDSVCEQIVKELKTLHDPVTGEKIEIEVFRREEIHQGPYAHHAPDIIVNAVHDGCILDDLYHPTLFESANWDIGTGTHRMEGIFLAYGSDIRKNHALQGTNLIDIAPTVMYALGLEVPDHMEGKVLVDIFDESFKRQNPVRFGRYGTGTERGVSGDTYSQDEEKKVKEALKGLGYLD